MPGYLAQHALGGGQIGKVFGLVDVHDVLK
jgi:hypothetical protein